MKVMLVNTYYYPEIVGGAEYSVKKLAEQLQRDNNEVVVLCTGDEFKDEYIDDIFVRRIRPQNACRSLNADKARSAKKLLRRMQDIWNPRNAAMIERILTEEKPDVIHTNGLYDITPIIWTIARQHNIRVVHTIRDYYLMCPLVSCACENKRFTCKFSNNLCRIHRAKNRKATRYVDCVTAPSRITLNTLCDHGFFGNAKKIVIPNATDYDMQAVHSILEKREVKDSVKFVYLGTLSEKKGIKWLIESFNSVSTHFANAELFLAGKGELEQYIKESCIKNPKIHYEGFLSEAEVGKLLSQMDVLVCPSLWNEPFGRVVLDAFKNAMPAIVSNRGALPELVSDHETGRIVCVEEEDALEKAMTEYIESPDTIYRHAKSAVSELEKYSLAEQANRFTRAAYQG